jgi:cysteinyl-tRNA synthetase
MSKKHLGETIDLHTGGVDLLFPHHENEIAQSQCCNGTTFAHHWYHSEHLLVDGTTMSKSKGNYYTLDDLSQRATRRWPCATPCSPATRASSSTSRSTHCTPPRALYRHCGRYRSPAGHHHRRAHDTFGHVITALHDDLNTPAALGALFTVVNRKGGEADLAPSTE